MSNEAAPAVDKVGATEPTAPEAQAAAPTMDTTEPDVAVCPPGPPNKTEEVPAEEVKASEDTKASEEAKAPEVVKTSEESKVAEEAKDSKESNVALAAKSAIKTPKPVEVVSVPETPINQATPANGTPRPELNIPTEPEEDVERPQGEPVVMAGVQEPLPTPTASIPNSDTAIEPIVDKPVTPNGDAKPAEMTGALQTEPSEQKPEAPESAAGEKRKLEDSPADAADEPPSEKQETDESERADKKVKVDAAETKTNGGAPARGRPGRPRKDKTAPPVVGKTARKTRSQGPVEV